MPPPHESHHLLAVVITLALTVGRDLGERRFAQRFLVVQGKDGVAGSIPAGGSTQALPAEMLVSRRPEPLWPTTSALEWDAEGQRAVRALIALLTSNFGRGASGMARIGLVVQR